VGNYIWQVNGVKLADILFYLRVRPSVRLCALKFRCKYIKKRFEIDGWYKLPTNRKWPMADRMMTLSMTSSDLQRSRSWSQYL